MRVALLVLLLTACATSRAPLVSTDTNVTYVGDDILVVDLVWVEPLFVWIGTGDPHAIRWGIARLLIHPDGLLAYGVTELNDGRAVSIVVDNKYWAHSTVLSHEIIHAVTGGTDEDAPLMQRCEFYVPGELLARPFPADSLEYYRSMALALGG